MFALKIIWVPYMLSLLVMYARLISVNLFNNKRLQSSDTFIMMMLIPLWPLMLLSSEGRKYLWKLFQ